MNLFSLSRGWAGRSEVPSATKRNKDKSEKHAAGQPSFRVDWNWGARVDSWKWGLIVELLNPKGGGRRSRRRTGMAFEQPHLGASKTVADWFCGLRFKYRDGNPILDSSLVSLIWRPFNSLVLIDWPTDHLVARLRQDSIWSCGWLVSGAEILTSV